MVRPWRCTRPRACYAQYVDQHLASYPNHLKIVYFYVGGRYPRLYKLASQGALRRSETITRPLCANKSRSAPSVEVQGTLPSPLLQVAERCAGRGPPHSPRTSSLQGLRPVSSRPASECRRPFGRALKGDIHSTSPSPPANVIAISATRVGTTTLTSSLLPIERLW